MLVQYLYQLPTNLLVKGTLFSFLFSGVKGEERREKDKKGNWMVNRETRERKGLRGETKGRGCLSRTEMPEV